MPHHSVGRRQDIADIRIDDVEVSNIHATLEWHDQHWLLRDLSRNGTWLNHRRVNKFQPTALQTGDVLHFGREGKNGWRVESIAPPTAVLSNQQSPRETIALEDFMLLPDEQHPEYEVRFNRRLSCWEVHALDAELNPSAAPELLFHGRIFAFGKTRWRVFLPPPFQSTEERKTPEATVQNLVFEFHVSLDEEHIALTILENNSRIELGERAHFYVFLHLARHCRAHQSGGGWINNSVLSQELGLDDTHINIQIYRIRRHLSSKLPHIGDWDTLIQRLRGETRLGIQADSIRIHKSAQPQKHQLNTCVGAIHRHA